MSDEKLPCEDRKTYHPPKIVHTEKMQGRAVSCAMATDEQCSAGPLQS